MIPYGKQSIDEDDIADVVDVLRSDWLTTGPKIEAFENALTLQGGVRHAVAVSSGTAALHVAMMAIGIRPGDEVIVPAITFAATANCVRYLGGCVVFADVMEKNLLIDPKDVERRITEKTKAIIAVDYAGHPCDYDALRLIANEYGLILVADACHSIGGQYGGRPVGSLADMTCFSFHPVKHITTGEGGAILTDCDNWAEKMRRFRNHGIDTTARQREEKGGWYYEMQELGFNYRITDIQCALGVSQLRKLAGWIIRRNEIAQQYDQAFAQNDVVRSLLHAQYDHIHAYHLYVVRVQNRDLVFDTMRAQGIGVNVHYIPVYRHPYYRRLLGDVSTEYPVADAVYKEILSLPMYPGLTDDLVARVVECIGDVVTC